MKFKYIVLFAVFLFCLPVFSQSREVGSDSLKKEVEELKEELEQQRKENERLKKEADIQRKAAEKYREEFESGQMNRREKRREKHLEKIKPHDRDIVSDIPDSLDKDQTVAFFKTGRNRVFQGFEIGISGFGYNEPFGFQAPDELKGFELNNIASINWAINPFEMDVRIINEYFKISTGLGYRVKNFTFSRNATIFKDTEGVVDWVKVGEPDYSRNRFRTGYVTVPLLFHINTNQNPAKSFQVAFGVLGGARIFETYRRRYMDDGRRVKVNMSRQWNVNQFTVDARASVAYGGFQLFASQSVIPLFKEGAGPELYPFTIGLSFVSSFE